MEDDSNDERALAQDYPACQACAECALALSLTMSASRRRIIRSPITPVVNGAAQQQRQLDKLRTRLHRERLALIRWKRRLKRAFTAVEKHQKNVARLEQKVAQMET